MPPSSSDILNINQVTLSPESERASVVPCTPMVAAVIQVHSGSTVHNCHSTAWAEGPPRILQLVGAGGREIPVGSPLPSTIVGANIDPVLGFLCQLW